jgi:hypothetical protein
VISFGAPPLLVYAALRRYLQGMHVVRPIMFALISANLVNAAGNWVLIYGHLGFPALGVEGSAWATTVARSTWQRFSMWPYKWCTGDATITRTYRSRPIRRSCGDSSHWGSLPPRK